MRSGTSLRAIDLAEDREESRSRAALLPGTPQYDTANTPEQVIVAEQVGYRSLPVRVVAAWRRSTTNWRCAYRDTRVARDVLTIASWTPPSRSTSTPCTAKSFHGRDHEHIEEADPQ